MSPQHIAVIIVLKDTEGIGKANGSEVAECGTGPSETRSQASEESAIM